MERFCFFSFIVVVLVFFAPEPDGSAVFLSNVPHVHREARRLHITRAPSSCHCCLTSKQKDVRCVTVVERRVYGLNASAGVVPSSPPRAQTSRLVVAVKITQMLGKYSLALAKNLQCGPQPALVFLDNLQGAFSPIS